MIPIAPIFIRSKEILEKLSSLLDEERLAYGELNSEVIISLSEQKQTLLDEMNQLNEKRVNILIKFDIVDRKKPTETEFKNWLSLQDSSMDNVRLLMQECETLLKKCKTQNNTNARILNTLQKRNKHLFELLQGHSSKNKVYTARGSTRPISSKHTLGRA
ncbi:MAG: flagellar protein FlgN [Gammaproteobacteria bacterium]|jgi:flagella synthesis protein FlgN|uniref:flagella synthesis protein FlgN n=1 Tax=Marinomonas TaxID=28253 RepID=UPI000C1E637C|nr:MULTISPECIES: flagellar protein FlgN [unclassified Marinomonas]MBU1294926.1 flagellar protein FlgN [Gammaproteobacteria bacterium]MBU1465065.1 flagellar protein FlgN [Gammaproteobacteria bacterium]MBU2020684.1 flagellar protein FlgN [Gammaproteobacteria bacterium]MBU2239056.1 flagellar protein FlgN [Gammaproteobacteria bacterium]MBU2320110.1 flagellar protein FlgN [Gammaproteobacteria bacterium]